MRHEAGPRGPATERGVTPIELNRVKATGIVRRVDELGRVTIPRNIRQKLEIAENTVMEIFIGENDEVIFRPLREESGPR